MSAFAPYTLDTISYYISLPENAITRTGSDCIEFIFVFTLQAVTVVSPGTFTADFKLRTLMGEKTAIHHGCSVGANSRRALYPDTYIVK